MFPADRRVELVQIARNLIGMGVTKRVLSAAPGEPKERLQSCPPHARDDKYADLLFTDDAR
jgi:hypothetical protein